MNRVFLTMACALAGVAAEAAWPEVRNVSLAQDSSRRVTVSYDLQADGFVTVELLTNGVPLKAAHAEVTGDVNGKVTAGAGRKIVWRPAKELSGGTLPEVCARVSARHPSCPPDYLAVDLQSGAKGYYATSNAVPGGVTDERYRTTSLLMRRIPAAGREWTMGCAPNASSYGGARQTGHRVVLSNDFYISVFPVTQGQFKEITGRYNPNSWDGANRAMLPAESASYNALRGSPEDGIDWPATGDAVSKESVIDLFRRRTGLLLDLPLDAQYEFACRAGVTADLYTGKMYRADAAGTNAVCEVAWCVANANGRTQVVGQLLPNGFGLYDMIGNVRSLCRDWYVEDLTTLGDRAFLDPVGGLQSEATLVDGVSRRVSRSMQVYFTMSSYTSATRSPELPDMEANYIGFRLVCPARNGGVIEGE
mgnify:CR=1 FL=1